MSLEKIPNVFPNLFCFRKENNHLWEQHMCSVVSLDPSKLTLILSVWSLLTTYCYSIPTAVIPWMPTNLGESVEMVAGLVRSMKNRGKLSHLFEQKKKMQGIELIHDNERGWLKVQNRCASEIGWVTHASRVQQVSPSTSPPGALSVLTDSFSLAGILTERHVWR